MCDNACVHAQYHIIIRVLRMVDPLCVSDDSKLAFYYDNSVFMWRYCSKNTSIASSTILLKSNIACQCDL